LLFVHPLLGVLALSAMFLAAVFGFRSRGVNRQRPVLRRRHRRLGPWALGAMVLALCTGLASTAWLRDDLDVATTWHATVGLGAVSLAVLAALLSRGLPRSVPLRTVHPVVAALALMLGVLGAILGIELLP
jgi:hypothetical protein